MEHLVLFGLTAVIFASLLSVVNAQPRQEGDDWGQVYNPLLDPTFAAGTSDRDRSREREEGTGEAMHREGEPEAQ